MSRRGWFLFLLLAFIWGTPYLFIRVAVGYLEPSLIVGGRVLLAALILIPIAAARGQLRGISKHLGWILIFAIIEISLPFLMLSYAEKRLTSSTTALLVAAVPIIAAIAAWTLRIDRQFGPVRIAGLGLGILGVAVLVGLDVGGGSLWAVGAAGIAAVGYAVAPIIVSTKLSDAPALGVAAIAIAINAVIYVPIGWLQRPAEPVPASAWWSVVWLGLVCTAIAFVVFFALIDEVGPTRMTVITYLNPAVALVLGVVVLSEPITWGLIIGFPLVLLGSYLATRSHKPELTELEDSPHP